MCPECATIHCPPCPNSDLILNTISVAQLGVAAMNASVFGCYKVAMNALLDGSGADPDATPSLWQVCIAGSASGVVTSYVPANRLFVLVSVRSRTVKLIPCLPHAAAS